MTVAKENVNKLRDIKSVGDYSSHAAALEAIAADGGRLYFPTGSYTMGTEPVDGSIIVFGEGVQSLIDGGFVIADTSTGTLVVEVKDLGFTGAAIDPVHVEQAGAADITLAVERITVDGTDTVVMIRNSGVIQGYIAHVKGTDLTDMGINVGWNNHTAQQEWGPLLIINNVIDGVDAGVAASGYGILTYAKHSIVVGNYIANITSDTGSDVEGLYTKAPYSVLAANVLYNAGEGEAFLNLKGQLPGITDQPNGHNIIAVGTNIHASDAYLAAGAQVVSGVNIATGNVIVSSTIIENTNEAGLVWTSGGDGENHIASELMVYDGTFSRGAVWLGSNGDNHVLRNFILKDITGIGIYLYGPDAEFNYYISDGVIDTVSSAGISIRPVDAAGLGSINISNVSFKDISGAACIFFDDAMIGRAELINIDCGYKAADFLDREAAAGALNWYVRNLYGRTQTTTNATVDLASFNVPPGKILAITVKWTGSKSDGTKLYHLERKAAYSNIAGTAAIIGSATDVFTQSYGTPGFSGSIAASGAGIVVRVTGVTAETIDWKVSIDLETM